MKTILLFTLGFAGLLSPREAAPQTIDQITQALAGGNVDAVMKYVDGELELSILDQEEIYPAPAARAALATFFTKFEPTAFNQRHQGSSKADDAEYVIGNLTTKNGSFRVYIYVAKRGGNLVLQELRFERA